MPPKVAKDAKVEPVADATPTPKLAIKLRFESVLGIIIRDINN